MTKFFDNVSGFLSKIVLTVPITIALGMLVVGGFVYSHQDPTADTDGDGILDTARNDSDVCIDEAYPERYHADCLTEAGLELPDRISSDDYKEAMANLNEQDIDISRSTINLEIETLTFEAAAIKTCRDLEMHRREMRDNQNTFRGLAIGAGILGGVITLIIGSATAGVGGVISGVIVAYIVTVLWLIAGRWGYFKKSAAEAFFELCRCR